MACRKNSWSVVLVLTYLGVFHKVKTEAKPSLAEQCDLNMWYLERAVEGAFSGELTREQLKIKASIEALIAKKPKDGLISCSTLTTFQNILSPSASSQTDVKSEDVDEGGSTAEKLAEASLETSKETTEKSDHRKQEGNDNKSDNVDSPHKEKESGGLKKYHQDENDEMTGEDSTEDEQPTKGQEDKETTHKQNAGNKNGSDKRSKIGTGSLSKNKNESAGSQHNSEAKHSDAESDDNDNIEVHDEGKGSKAKQSSDEENGKNVKKDEDEENSVTDAEEKENQFQDGAERKEHSADSGGIINQTRKDQNTFNTENNQTRSGQECPFLPNLHCPPERLTSRWPDYIIQSNMPSVNNSSTLPPFSIFAKCKSPQCSKRKRPKIKLRASSIHCYYYHAIEYGQKNKQNRNQPGRLTVADVIKESCRLPNKCSWPCFYGTHNQQCVVHYDLQVNETETPSTQDDMNHKGSHHTDHTETKNSEEESDETEPQELNEEENKNKLQEDTPAAESDDTAPDAKHQDEETAKESESMASDETDVDGALTGEKHAEQSSDDESTTEEKGKDNPTRGSESGTEKEHTSCKSNENAEAERMQNANSEPHGNKKVRHEDSGLSEAELLKLEAMFQHKVLEQATKIQSLEILIMRLENHILSQKLNEQNGTNHLVYLENQILRIENELLKLNRSYVDLHAENEMLKSRQNKYLALEHKSKENNTMSLPGNTSEYFQLVLKQQEKITALSELLTNQSSALHKLQSRSDQLEEQNQMLHQIILNQTALISQVVQKLQEVSEQTAKNQQETSHLKSVMNLQSASSNILTKLEHMLNDFPNAGNPSVKTTHSQQSSDQIRHVLKILHQHPDPSSRLPQHNCKNGKHSRVCLYFSLIISSCPPFRTLSWGHCQHLISAIGPIMGAEQNANHGHNVNTQDKSSSTFSKNIHADSKRMDSNPESDPEHPEISKEKGRSQKKEDSDVSSKNDHKQHKAEQKTDEEKEAPDSVDLPDIKLGSKESEINSEAPDEQKAKSSDKGPLPEMRPLAVKAEDVKEPETTNTQTEDNKKPEKDGDKLGGTKENEEKELASKKTEKQNEKESKGDEKEDIKDKTLKSETNKDEAKTISENKDTLHNKDKFTETQDTVAIVVKMDQQTSGPANPSPSKDSQNQQAGDKTASGIKTETQIPSSKIDGSKEGGISEEDRKRKEEAEKALKMKQEAEALQKRIQEAETRRAAYWSADNKKPKDCYDLYKRAARAGQGPLRNGAYKVFVQGLNLYVSVYCDMKAGGWTVLLKREDGSLDFYRDWDEYRDGFGTPFGEHYVGNEAIHYLTNQDHYSLQVDLKDWAGQTRTAHYRHFWLEDEEKNFQLRVLGYSGTAGDGLAKHDGMAFSTQDRDHDLLAENKMGGSCARRFMGAGWYYKCYTNNLMGRYYENGVVPEKRFDGIAWKPWKGPSYSLKEVVLKVRPKGVVLGG